MPCIYFFPIFQVLTLQSDFFCLCFLMHFLPNCNFRECKKRKTTNVDKKDRVLCKNTFRVCFLIQRRHVCWGLFGFFYSSFSLYLFLFCSFNTLLYTHFGYSQNLNEEQVKQAFFFNFQCFFIWFNCMFLKDFGCLLWDVYSFLISPLFLLIILKVSES